MNVFKLSPTLIILSFQIILLLMFSVKGSDIPVTPENILTSLRDEGMPFELSPERGRYALVNSIVENRSVYFSTEIAKYVLPDLGFYNNKYVSLFPPGTSIAAIPYYYLGKSTGNPQYFVFLTSSTFALFSCLVLYRIIKKLTDNPFMSVVSVIAYLFGTTAYAYSTTLYQHHLVGFGILVGICLLISEKELLKTTAIWAIAGLLFFIEYQSLIFYIPVLIFNLIQNIKFEDNKERLIIKLNLKIFAGLLFFLLSLVPFLVYNNVTYGKYFQLAGMVKSSKEVYEDPVSGELVIPSKENYQSVKGFFHIYRLPRSVSVLLTSKDRGVIYFSPIIIFSLLGIVPLYKRNKDLAVVSISIALIVLVLYGMWGDPWGGWAFGTRYLIPAFAVLTIPMATAIQKYGRKWYFYIPFLITAAYSIFINLAGGLTTNQIPPSVEADSSRYPTFTFLHNIRLILDGKTSSYIYKAYLSNIDMRVVFGLIYLLIIIYLISNYYQIIKNKNS